MNLSTIKPFFIHAEAVPDCGEDSGFVGCYENGLVVTGVFDGCGGIGGKRYPEVNGRTGAYIGSQTAAFAADAFFKRHGEKFKNVKNQKEQLQLFQQIQECISGKLANVKKKLIIVFAVIAAVLLLIPVRKVYEDGGTQTYTSLTYKVIVWKQIDGKSGTELYLFPNNFHQLDYYE